MMKNMMRRNLYQSIVHSLGRYIAIAVIIALGAAMFVGLRSTRNDMVATGQKFTDEQNMFDLRLITSYGWGRDQLESIRKIDGLTDAEGVFYMDLIVQRDSEGADAVYRFYSMPERINILSLRGGRMPQRTDECLADGFRNDDRILGTQITISDENDEDSLEKITTRTYTVVGYVATPLYMDMNRGNTSVGNGSISNYFFLPEEAFDVDYYTEIHATIPGEHALYSDEYNDSLADMKDYLEPILKPLAQERLEKVKTEAEEKYRDGIKEYEDGVTDYQEAKEDVRRELYDAFKEILDGEDTLRRSEVKLQKGEKQLFDARDTLKENRKTLALSRKTLADTRASTYQQISDGNTELMKNYQFITSSMREVDDGLLQINAGILELDSGIIQIESGLTQLDSGINQLQMLIDIADTGISTAESALEFAEENGADAATIAILRERLKEYEKTRDEYVVQLEELYKQRAEVQAKREELQKTKDELLAQKEELEQTKGTLQAGLETVEAGFAELIGSQAMAEKQFAAAEAQIDAGESQLLAYEAELDRQEKTLSDGWEDLREGKEEWRTGYKDYCKGRREAAEELREAEQELADAKAELADARETLDKMTRNDLIILDRNSNMGYASLDSSSNIVAGVSKVFPAFFLLVAALVCITTMTRMVDDERTQIGTLKALGYGNWAIISKYLVYAGSSALFGCTLGVALGSVVFPTVLWEAYKIMLYVTPNITIKMDWPLGIIVVCSYTLVMLLVTWYCCRRELREVPAELIRPKAPAGGKELILERLSVWKKLSFLNKVAVRNIFRYRQRLAMMMLGIGGCTALLLTGYGIRDSIMDIVDIQFEEVTRYDIETYFRSGRTEEEMQDFRDDLRSYAEDVLFFYQSSVEMDFESQTKDITMIVAPEHLTNFIDFHRNGNQVPYPAKNQAVVTTGMADMIGVGIGDRIVLRNPDLEQMELTVSGIYENHVYNYVIIGPDTYYEQWGREAEDQMAYVKVLPGQDVHTVGAVINGLSGVMNVTVNEELASMVSRMMQALDLVVIVVVFCAGLLAAIVLYNLTNINITERIREIATIKVLGFNALESAMYVFKENLVLSVMGSCFGVPMGLLLLRFVVSQIKIDMIWLEPRLKPMSYGIALVLTIAMGIIVDFVFYFRLEKINMAEALKSVE